MAEFNADRARAVAIELKQVVLKHYIAYNALYQEVSSWVLHCDSQYLPDPNSLRIWLDAYNTLPTLDSLSLSSWATELEAATYGDTYALQPSCGVGSGYFDGQLLFDGQPGTAPAPETPPEAETLVKEFKFYAPVTDGQSTSITAGADLLITSLSGLWFTPDASLAFEWDLLLDGVSMLLEPAKAITVTPAAQNQGVELTWDWNAVVLNPNVPDGSEVTVQIVAPGGTIQFFKMSVTCELV